jgi:hypothetical protein
LTILSESVPERPSRDRPGEETKPWATSWELTYSRLEEEMYDSVELDGESKRVGERAFVFQWMPLGGVAAMVPPRLGNTPRNG